MAFIIGSISSFDPKDCRFGTYISRLRAFFVVNAIKADNQVAVFITVMGDQMFQLLVNLYFPEDPMTKMFDKLVAILTLHFEPPSLEVAERQHFLARRQQDGESLSSFVADLKRLSLNCNYGEHLSAALRDQLVAGIRNDSTKRRLLTEVGLTFDKAVNIAGQLEVADKEVVSLQTTSSLAIQNIARPKPIKKKFNSKQQTPSVKKSGSCHRCGSKDHWPPKCPHIHTTCNKCQKNGHLAKVCRSSNKMSSSKSSGGSVGTVKRSSYLKDGAHVLHTSNSPSLDAIIIPVTINSTTIDMDLDTGATYSIIGLDHWKQIGSPKVTSSSISLRTYNQQSFPIFGKFNASVSINNKVEKVSIIVVRSSSLPALLGRDLLSNFPMDWNYIYKRLYEVIDNPYMLIEPITRATFAFLEDLYTSPVT